MKEILISFEVPEKNSRDEVFKMANREMKNLEKDLVAIAKRQSPPFVSKKNPLTKKIPSMIGRWDFLFYAEKNFDIILKNFLEELL